MATPTLLTLPNELRDQIYLHTFPHLHPTKTKFPQEPPITIVSKHIRSESLPLFYATTPLRTHAFINYNPHNEKALYISYPRPSYYDLLPSRFPLLRILEMRLEISETSEPELTVPVCCTITLKRHSEAGFEVRYSFPDRFWRSERSVGDPADCKNVLSIIDRHYKQTLKAANGEAGVVELSVDVLDRLLEVDVESLP